MSVIGKRGYPFVYLRYFKPVFKGLSYDYFTMVANRVYLMPIQVPIRLSVDRIIVFYRGTVAGNIRAGIYEDNGETPQGAALIVESASVAKSGTWRKQEITITETELHPGLYWVAVQSDESTTIMQSEERCFVRGGSLRSYYYDLGSYGPFTDPCPTVSEPAGENPAIMLRVSSVYQPS